MCRDKSAENLNSHDDDLVRATKAVLVTSDEINADFEKVKGIDFNAYHVNDNNDITVDQLVKFMSSTGFQSSCLAEAISVINEMRSWRHNETNAKATIFLGYTSNMVSSGLREVLRYLVQHKQISAIVSTAGGIEEDLIKCLAPTYLGSFTTAGSFLRDKGFNRIGNLLVPNNNYCLFENWVLPILNRMLEEQNTSKNTCDEINWTPSKIIRRLGKEINHEDSICYWAYKNNIPIFCPALTDGSLGDMMFFHTFRQESRLRCDIIEDIRAINSLALNAAAAGMIILGGGIIKHHIANACLMRNGADFAVYINTAQEFDGSDAGASPDEAVSWGKIRACARSVKVHADATIVFPLIVAATFFKHQNTTNLDLCEQNSNSGHNTT